MTTLGIRQPEWRLRPHGTPAAARRHYRHGTTPCEPCLQAMRRAEQDRRGGSDSAYNTGRRANYRAWLALGFIPAQANARRHRAPAEGDEAQP